MSELWAFLQIGYHHIVARDAADHILFLLALAAIYRGTTWRAALWVVSAFTVGHSVTLALAVTNLLVLPSRVVEFLIPVTIVVTGLENLILRERAARGQAARHRPVFAGVFGLVHGAGFADYLRSLFVDRIVVPLVGFNLGIELGQLVVLAVAGIAFWLVDRALNASTTRLTGVSAFHWRLVGVSVAVTAVAGHWAWARWPA